MEAHLSAPALRSVTQLLLGSLLPVLAGCTWQKDLTRTQAVKDTGLVGACYAAKASVRLVQSRGDVLLMPQDTETDWRVAQVVDTLPEGTRFRVMKVLERGHYDGMFIVRVHDTLARIESGAHSGETVQSGALVSVIPRYVREDILARQP